MTNRLKNIKNQLSKWAANDLFGEQEKERWLSEYYWNSI